MKPRGIRNNNPLNIRVSDQGWKGKVNPSKDPSFEQFETMAYGIRAAIVLVRNYIKKHHANTPTTIISRWAPPSENATSKYLEFVCSKSGLTPHQFISFDSKFNICRLLWAMSIYENGEDVGFSLFLDAWLLL